MNKIGIIGAMEEEVALLLEKIKLEEKVEKAGLEFYVGKLRGKDVVVVKCGVGKVNSCYVYSDINKRIRCRELLLI